MPTETTAAALRSEVAEAIPRLRAIPEERAGRDPGAGKWCLKEILGHLIDSAMNNHQRFLRAPMASRFEWPGYDQDAWVSRQHYRERRWAELVDIWGAINTQVAYAIESIPADSLDITCVIGEDPPVTLGWIVTDYLRHLRHHLAQLWT
jgi:hypothetical protein